MTEEHGSVAFDRAAEYYDATRGFSPEGERAMTALLCGELAGRGRAVEVGVGTGQVALPLHRAEGAFGGAYLRWVLHLIPDWRAALTEMVRVVRPGGVLLTSIGGYGGIRSEIQERFAQLAGVSLAPPGLMWAGYDELDEAMAALGATARELPSYTEVERDSLEDFMGGIVRSRYSWTCKVPDPTVLARVADDVRAWAEERYGPLHSYPEETSEIVWRAYDLPA